MTSDRELRALERLAVESTPLGGPSTDAEAAWQRVARAAARGGNDELRRSAASQLLELRVRRLKPMKPSPDALELLLVPDQEEASHIIDLRDTVRLGFGVIHVRMTDLPVPVEAVGVESIDAPPFLTETFRTRIVVEAARSYDLEAWDPLSMEPLLDEHISFEPGRFPKYGFEAKAPYPSDWIPGSYIRITARIGPLAPSVSFRVTVNARFEFPSAPLRLIPIGLGGGHPPLIMRGPRSAPPSFR